MYFPSLAETPRFGIHKCRALSVMKVCRHERSIGEVDAEYLAVNGILERPSDRARYAGWTNNTASFLLSRPSGSMLFNSGDQNLMDPSML